MAKNQKTKQPSIRELRSINIALDIGQPERLKGYIPTQKSINLSKEIFSAFTGETSTRAFSVAAPYGSGKSSAGLLWCTLAEASGKLPPDVASLLDAFRKAPSTGVNPFNKLSRNKKAGIAVPITGYEGGVSLQIRDGLIAALERNDQESLATKIKKLPCNLDGLLSALKLAQESLTHKQSGILIVWDEFGKVLEHCAASGDSRALYEMQSIAEFVARTSNEFPIVLTLLLHQSFARYASGLPNYVKTEWAKIEGRFRQFNYVEDSKEVYQLIAQIVSGRAKSIQAGDATFTKLAKRCHQAGIFKEFDAADLADLLRLAAPLTPVALYILPKISGRVAQNERTLFTFIHSDEPHSLGSASDSWVTPAQVYDFFSDLMRLDTSAGGTHRNWVETNLALRKAVSTEQTEIIKALAAIKLASGQQAIPGNEETLALSFAEVEGNRSTSLSQSIQALVDSKAIFHRRITNDYSVWQGSDVDIRTTVDELKAKLEGTFDLAEFLNKEHRPPYQRPQRYNDTHAINRYFDGRYISPAELAHLANWEATLGNDPIRDGRIYYVLAETQAELKECRELASALKQAQVIVALPRKPLTLRDTVCELKAYYQLLNDPEFCGQDPVIEQELKQLVDESETFLRAQIDQLTLPSDAGPTYFYQGTANADMKTIGQLRKWLSEICERVFSKTPRFNNEMINKADPSAQIVNARKKLLRAMLLSTGTEHLSLEGYGPEVAIYRAILLNTGLYSTAQSGTWAFSEPSLKGSKALKEVWHLLLDYWTTPATEPKNTHQLIKTLLAPPFGLREGVLPLLFAASLKSTHSTVTVLEDGVYVSELKAETFERLIRSPRAFVVSVPVLEDGLDQHLAQVISLFKAPEAEINNPVRRAVEGIMKWARALPPVSLQKGVNSSSADELIDLLMTAVDPLKLMTKDMVRVAGNRGYKEVLSWLKERKTELEKTESKMLSACREQLFRAVGAHPQGALVDALRQWKGMLPGDAESYLGDRVLAGFLTRIDQHYATETELLLSLASHFTGKSLRYWDRTNLPQFELSLLQTVKRIEDIADRLDIEAATLSKSDRISIPWTERRLKIQIQALTERLGAKKTKQLIQSLITES
jgi:hypothetical protein